MPLPPLGIFGRPAIKGDFDSIATVTVGSGGASSVTFDNIAGTYKHLQIRFIARTARAANEDNIQIRLNNDSTGNYAAHVLYGDGTTAGAFSDGTSITWTARTMASSANATASVFGAGVYDILDYTNTNKNKTVRALSGYDNNGGGQVRLSSGLWMSTNAVTRIDLIPANANLVQYSTFALYGVK